MRQSIKQPALVEEMTSLIEQQQPAELKPKKVGKEMADYEEEQWPSSLNGGTRPVLTATQASGFNNQIEKQNGEEEWPETPPTQIMGRRYQIKDGFIPTNHRG